MASISNISLRNYKNLHEVDLDLKPLNILIGVNGAGKSNFLSFFRLLSEGAKEKLADKIGDMGGFNEIRRRGSNEAIEWALTFESLQSVLPQKINETVFYTGILASRGSSYSIRKEELSQPPSTGFDENYYYLRAAEGRPNILKSRKFADEEKIEEDSTPYSDHELLIAQVGDRRTYPLLNEVRSLLSDWITFRGFGEGAIENISKPQPLKVVEPLRLNPAGDNLLSVLYSLRDSDSSSIYRRLKDLIATAFPDFEDFSLPLVGSGVIELIWKTRQGPFPAKSLSDGMLRFLGLAVLLLLPDPPSLITIDEPEIGLHPSLISLLAELLKRASERTQIIVTTHSPLLLNAEAITLEDIVLVEPDEVDQTVHMVRADSQEHLKKWVERYSLGNLWTMNKLKLGN